MSTKFYTSPPILYPFKTNFWLRPWLAGRKARKYYVRTNRKASSNASRHINRTLTHRRTHTHVWTVSIGDGSLRPADFIITDHVTSSIYSEAQPPTLPLTDPSVSGTTSWAFPFGPVIRSNDRHLFFTSTKEVTLLLPLVGCLLGRSLCPPVVAYNSTSYR